MIHFNILTIMNDLFINHFLQNLLKIENMHQSIYNKRPIQKTETAW